MEPLSGRWTKRRLIVLFLTALVIGGIAAILVWRPRSEPLSQMVPDGALAYVEIEDPAKLAEQFSTTQAYQALAPKLGWPQRLSGIEFLRGFMDLTGLRQQGLEMLLSAHVALAVTGVEIEGGQFRPHLTLLFQPKAPPQVVEKWMVAQLKPLADRVYGPPVEEASDYAGRKIHSYKSPDGSRRIAWCMTDRVALIANHADAIQQILDIQDHRKPSLDNFTDFQRLRAARTNPLIFGYVNTQPIARKLQQFTWPTDLSASPERLAVDALEILLTAFNISLAYRLEVENGVVVERYHLPRPLELHLEPAAGASETHFYSLQFIPQQSRSFTILRLGDLEPLSQDLDSALNRRLSVVSSIALREIIIRFKRTWGLDERDTIVDALGGEIALVEGNHPELLFIMQAKRKSKLVALVGKYLQRGGASTRSVQYDGFDIYTSTHESRKAFSFVDDLLLAGPLELVKWAIRARQQSASIDHVWDLRASIERYGQGAVEISVRLDRQEEARRIAAALQRTSSRPQDVNQILSLLRSLPPTIRTTSLSDKDLVTETRSPLGELPFLLIGNQSNDGGSALGGR
ncbi:MAG: DUF3352 domain-containing protein [Acidobacteria bacterium]|nr:DUF3352 domain-containing protein [Acidobacteriota bacterium]